MTDVRGTRRRRLKLFPTPVIIDELADSAEVNAQLEATILERMRSDPGVRRSNLGGWQSSHDLTAWAGDVGQRVVRHAGALARSSTVAQGGAGISWSIEAWANVSASGASNRAHIHGASYWSAVYYVAVGAGEGGELLLHDPRMPALRMHAPHLRFKDTGPEIFASIKPKPGLMILFPAWLSHSVQPWAGEESRISIAMNIRATPAAQRRGPPAPGPRPTPNKDN